MGIIGSNRTFFILMLVPHAVSRGTDTCDNFKLLELCYTKIALVLLHYQG